MSSSTDAVVTLGSSKPDASMMGRWPEHMEVGPASPGIRRFAGEMDVKNRYVSTVMLALKDPRELPDCSGILLAPRMVLTAASCVCAPREQMLGSVGEDTRVGASTCAKRVFVTAVVYGEVGSSKLKELSTQMWFYTAEGSVRPHPELELVLDRRGFVLGGRADLAVVLLDRPLDMGRTPIRLSRDEAQEGEFLVMAGYGHDEAVGGFYGARYFRKNRVKGSHPSEGGRLLYEQQGTYAYNGFDGGPCLREDGGQLWLVGVASARADQELTCTSTTVYRDWILEEMKRAPSQEGE